MGNHTLTKIAFQRHNLTLLNRKHETHQTRSTLIKLSFFFIFYCQIVPANLTLKITLEQFLIVQESEYLQWLLSAQLFHCVIPYTPNMFAASYGAASAAQKQVFYSLLDAVRARWTYRIVRYNLIPADRWWKISNKWAAVRHELMKCSSARPYHWKKTTQIVVIVIIL